MADAAVSPQTDRDLASIAEARALARRAKQAWTELAEFPQEKIDAIVGSMAEAATAHAEAFARLAIDETGFGVYEDKIQKNLFASQRVYDFIKPMKTVGVIARHEDRRVVEIAEPFGVVAAIVPSTNPTSTASRAKRSACEVAAAAIASTIASIFSWPHSASSSHACLARRASARASAIDARSRSDCCGGAAANA